MTNDSQEKPTAMVFEVLKAAIIDGSAARLGRMALAGRRSVDTPNYLAVASRGVVPHMTPDNVGKYLHSGGVYMALEEVIERPQQYSKRQTPIYDTPTSHGRRPLHSFTAMPSDLMTVLSARRLPAVPSPMGNSNASISIFTSTGYQVLTTKEYQNAVETLRPDIAIPLADLTYGPITPTSKRALRMAERTDEWLKNWFADEDASADGPQQRDVAVFAPVLPVSYSIQWEYLERLSEELSTRIAGLAVYNPDVLLDLLSDYANLATLPRLSVSAVTTPHHILRQISLGFDAFVLPFINLVSDAGIAMTFTFPPSQTTPTLLPLGVDLSSPACKTSLAPLSPNCTCYACTAHHAAYVHHLLGAREMLGWTLLQTHNHTVVAAFFASVRAALAQGEEAFEGAAHQFALRYEPEFPAGTGERPRARGYQFKGEAGGEVKPKLNKPAWGKLDGEGGGLGLTRVRAKKGVAPAVAVAAAAVVVAGELVESDAEGGARLETPPVSDGVADVDAQELNSLPR
ncbi:tRNA-guanine(15) transglycosylase-like protein [Lasiosphaeris hirsuta]|uniref:Queuine tRNA-ribosyltransferase accessory subunit 2 n=1 Tax=Lasiosphaeris hirsuta TaxID=260670 RepID=A0AA40AQ35_9PEZI|nr:tRNA-guanine(15) transglycosylase-like protein [Lasiosphaeris hirsuta]